MNYLSYSVIVILIYRIFSCTEYKYKVNELADLKYTSLEHTRLETRFQLPCLAAAL